MNNQPVESDTSSKSAAEGVAAVIELISKELNSSDPLLLCKKLLSYLNTYTDQLQEKRKARETEPTASKLKI